ncbi:MAG TPA: zinc-binding dehydrogenase [Chloroflexota bacterium]|nr:zinc-binding dehydrogenase [Chloroflexota bacterium]
MSGTGLASDGGPGGLTGRAVWFTGPRQVEVRAEPVGLPGPGEVLIEGLYSLVSAGTEMLIYRGETDAAWDLGHPLAVGSFGFPVKYAYQTVGRVVEAGAHTDYRTGDIVFARHPHQTLFAVPADPPWLVKLPDDVHLESATFLNLMEVALNGLLDVPVRVGDVVVVYGQGIVGSFCGQLAKRSAGVVVVVDPIEERRAFASRWGADAAVHPAEAKETLLDRSEGRGADIAFEASGAPGALQSAIEVVGLDGTVGVLSMYGTREVRLRLTPEFHFGRTRIVSSQAGHLGGGVQARWDMTRRGRTAARLIGQLDVKSMITHVIDIEDAPAAYALVDQHPKSTLGVVLAHHR